MTEAEWLASVDADQLLLRARFRSSRRKSRLFAAACCRLIWPTFVDARSRAAVEVAERFADGVASEGELRSAEREASAVHQEMFDALGKAGAWAEAAAAEAAGGNPFSAAKNAVSSPLKRSASSQSEASESRLAACGAAAGGMAQASSAASTIGR